MNVTAGTYLFFDADAPGKAIHDACEQLCLGAPDSIDSKQSGTATATVEGTVLWAGRVSKRDTCPEFLKSEVFDSQYKQS